MNQGRIAFRSTRTLGIRRPVRPSVLRVLVREAGPFAWLTVCFWSLGQITPVAKLFFDDRYYLLPFGVRVWVFAVALGWIITVAGIIANAIAATGKLITRLEPCWARARNRSLSW